MSVQYVKRFQMVFEFSKSILASSILPVGFRFVPWTPTLLETHADVKHRGFRNDSDAKIFPTFRDYSRCVGLMQSISSNSAFVPEATLLIANGDEQNLFEYVACIQGMKLSGEVGAIQNVAVLPDYRGRGLGRALVLGSLNGFRQTGSRCVTLEVTADNLPATKLYSRIGFRILGVRFREFIE
jgi:ribosomal protein S18 acetylase RimI-like enzyme